MYAVKIKKRMKWYYWGQYATQIRAFGLKSLAQKAIDDTREVKKRPHKIVDFPDVICNSAL